MFRSARFKLTAWYLLIIMLISAAFSIAVYRAITPELEQGFRRAEMRLRAEQLGIPLPRQLPTHPEDLRPELRGGDPHFFLVEDLEAAKRGVLYKLLSINGIILILSASAGYFLAGKTLKPIEDALEEQRRFVADASHELRTPLAAMKTSVEVSLRDDQVPIQAKAILRDNLEEIDSLVLMTNSLLELAQHQEEHNGLKIDLLRIAALIDEASKQILPLAEEKGVDVVIRSDPEDILIEADADRMKKLVVILLDNAVKYTPGGGKVTVAARRIADKVVLIVEDTGIGIDRAHLPHIFNRFYRAESSRTRSKTPGFGLGLALAKRIIEEHHGSVDVTSQIDKGTKFTISLPLRHRKK